jgi:hypothetical protein
VIVKSRRAVVGDRHVVVPQVPDLAGSLGHVLQLQLQRCHHRGNLIAAEHRDPLAAENGMDDALVYLAALYRRQERELLPPMRL